LSRAPTAPEPAGVAFRRAEPSDVVEVRDFLMRAHAVARIATGSDGPLTVQAGQQLRDLVESEGGAVLLAVRDGRVCGTVAIFPAGADGSNVWRRDAFGLRHLAVEPELRGLGVSDALLDEAVQWARPRGARGLCVHVPHPSHGLARVLARHGFRRDDSGDFDRGSLDYLEAYFLDLG
jgi:GNAT superfamily N-acetyltransferase